MWKYPRHHGEVRLEGLVYSTGSYSITDHAAFNGLTAEHPWYIRAYPIGMYACPRFRCAASNKTLYCPVLLTRQVSAPYPAIDSSKCGSSSSSRSPARFAGMLGFVFFWRFTFRGAVSTIQEIYWKIKLTNCRNLKRRKTDTRHVIISYE